MTSCSMGGRHGLLQQVGGGDGAPGPQCMGAIWAHGNRCGHLDPCCCLSNLLHGLYRLTPFLCPLPSPPLIPDASGAPEPGSRH